MKRSFILLGLTLLTLASCKKEVTQEAPKQAYGIVYGIQPDAWAANEDSTSYSAVLKVPELNNPIFDHGAVITYLSFIKDDNGNPTIYEALPEVFDGISYGAIHSTGSVTVDFHALDGSKLLPPSDEVPAKIVLISADKIALYPNVNLQNYNEVKKVFGVKNIER